MSDAPTIGGRGPAGATPYFKAVAVDFDGTLTDRGSVDADVLDAILEVRERGVRLVLATGRVLDELREVFPELERAVDAVVAENGAVVVTPFGTRLLAPPVDGRLADALRARGVAARSGEVLLACGGSDELTVLEEVRRLGLDYQLVRNRAQLMVLPQGVTKGAGLFEALGDLGISHHNTVAVGDAENDLSMLRLAEVGVAVANAVQAVRDAADQVLDRAAGRGVVDLLGGELLAGTALVHPRRWQLVLGADDRGDLVRLPASQLNLLISGGTGEGKSYLAGHIAEQLVGLGYSLLVIDPEGDHTGLGRLRGVLVLGESGSLPPDVGPLLRHRFSSVVLDLAGLGPDEQAAYLRQLPAQVQAERAADGLPQWVLVDEAHRALARQGGLELFDPAGKGNCIVTWKPEDLLPDVAAGIDAVVALTGPDPSEGLVDITAAVSSMPRAAVARLLTGRPGRGILAWRARPGRVGSFDLATRATPHVRHRRKYDLAGLPPERRFRFLDDQLAPTGAEAGNLEELATGLAGCNDDSLRHHCAQHDLSRWATDVLHDPWLAAALSTTESVLGPASTPEEVGRARATLLAAIRHRQRA